MKADSIPTNRNRQAFYTYRKRPSPSPSVCSSASSSAASASASASASTSRSGRAALGSNRRRTSSSHLNPASKTGLLQRADSIPSTSAGTNREFEALLEREYHDEVLAYMADMEAMTGASVELIDQQPELQWYMRPYLIDFLVEIHSQYRLRPETLYLAVNIADRYTSKRIVYKRHYQLVGCAALWIAAKFEDAKDRVPTVQDLCAMTCNAYDASAFIQMEGHVLQTLNWLIGHPTAESWLRVQGVDDPSLLSCSDSKLASVTRFLMEITLFHRAFVPLKSSEIVLGCLLLARFMLGKGRKMEDETFVATEVAKMLDGHLAEHLEQVSAIVVKKYSQQCFSSASMFVREWYLAGKRFDMSYWPTSLPSIASTSTLTPTTFPLRRGSSSASSIFSSVTTTTSSSSPRSYIGNSSSSDDEEMPLTPSTPLTQYGSSEDDLALSSQHHLSRQSKPSPLSNTLLPPKRNASLPCSAPTSRITIHSSLTKQKEITPPSAPPLQVKLVPTSGPSMTLC